MTPYPLANFALQKGDLQKLQLGNNRVIFNSKSKIQREDHAGFGVKYLPMYGKR